MSDFKSLMVRDVTFLWNHSTEPTIYNSHEGRSVEVPPSTPGAAWSLSFKVTPANDNMIMAAAREHFYDCKSRDSRLGEFSTIHGRKEEDGEIRYNSKRKTVTSRGKQNQPPRLVDAKRMPLEDRNFWGGSTGNIKVTMMPTLNQSSGQWGVSLLLDSAQIVKAVYGDAAEDFDVVEAQGGNAYDFDDEIPFS